MELNKIDPEVASAIESEFERQRDKLELIASENYVSEAVMAAQGCVMTNKYAEGYPAKRYYGGCVNVDKVEALAIERCKKIFGAEHANVQPHSGSQANMGVYFAVLNVGDTILGMDLSCGGHLTHGSPANFSGILYTIAPYGVNRETEMIDYGALQELAYEKQPKMIVAGGSAYARIIDFERMRQIADSVQAYLMVDMAHFAGLVAAGIYPSPIPHSDFVTTTTHKTLRGPRGGIILCKEKYAKQIDKAIFPGIQGGPLMHTIAAKAVALGEAMTESFNKYQRQIVANAKKLVEVLQKGGIRIVSGGTDSHLLLADLTPLNITGKDAQISLEIAGITVNKNTIPYDTKSPFVASGIRIGTPAVTTRGMKEKEMEQIGEWIVDALKHYQDTAYLDEIRKQVNTFCQKFPLFLYE